MWVAKHGAVLVICYCFTAQALSQSGDAENHRLPFGARLKITKHVRRQTVQLPGDALHRVQRGFVYQQPIMFVHPGLVYQQPPTTQAAGYIYKTPPTTQAPGYIYKTPTTTAPGYVYRRPTTTPPPITTTEPAIEQEQDIDSVGLTPAPPPPVYPEKEFEQSPVDDTPDKWDIRDSVPGTPGDDYPVLGAIPKTSFRCEGRIPGYYADPETNCQVFHRCSDCADNVRLYMDSFLCPNGTQFNQEILSCDWWENVHCNTATKYYSINEELNAVGEDGKYLQLSAMRHAPQAIDKKIAPGIIPKKDRQPLPPQYRSQHNHDHGDSHSRDSPTPTRESIIFNEFRKPIPSSRTTTPPITNDEIESALNNPDYFNIKKETTSTESTPTNDKPELSDEDYFNSNDGVQVRSNSNDEVQVRSSIEDFGDKLDNDPLNPPPSRSPMTNYPFVAKTSVPLRSLKKSTTIPTSQSPSTISTPATTPFKMALTTTKTFRTPSPTTPSTIPTVAKNLSKETSFYTDQPQTTTITETTTKNPPESQENENEVQALIPFHRQSRQDDEASGFIVNRKPENLSSYSPEVTEQEPSPTVPIHDEKDDDYLLPPKKYLSGESEEVSPTYSPPTSLPNLNYLPASTPKPEYGLPKDSYLPQKSDDELPKDSYLPQNTDSNQNLPEYQLNPYVVAPIPQHPLVQPSPYNYVTYSGGFGQLGAQQTQSQLNIIAPQIPIISFGQFQSSQIPQYTNYINPAGGYDFSALASSNYYTSPYFG